MLLLKSPLGIQLSKKKQFILNLNNYRNVYFRALNNAKIKYKAAVMDEIERECYYPLNIIAIHYTVFKGDHRRCDIGNIASIHQKFFEDALVELGHLPDDSYKNIPVCSYSFGGIDKDNPRVEIRIFNLLDRIDKMNYFKYLRGTIKENLKSG